MSSNLQVRVINNMSKNLDALRVKFPEMIKEAEKVAAHALLEDAIMEAPRPYLDSGNLKASGYAGVDEKVVATGSSLGFQGGESPGKLSPENPNTITVGFNTNYAEKLDQGKKNGKPYRSHNTTDNEIGMHYLTDKLLNDPLKPFRIIAQELSRRLRK